MPELYSRNPDYVILDSELERLETDIDVVGASYNVMLPRHVVMGLIQRIHQAEADSPADDEPKTFTGTVSGVEGFGQRTKLWVDCEDGTALLTVESEDYQPEMGDSVTVYLYRDRTEIQLT